MFWLHLLVVARRCVMLVDEDAQILVLGDHLAFRQDIWDTREATEEARMKVSFDRMKVEILEFYRADRARDIYHSVEVQDLTPGMFGTDCP